MKGVCVQKFKNEADMLLFEHNRLRGTEQDYVWLRYVSGDRRVFLIVVGKRHPQKLERFFVRADKLCKQYKTTISL